MIYSYAVKSSMAVYFRSNSQMGMWREGRDRADDLFVEGLYRVDTRELVTADSVGPESVQIAGSISGRQNDMAAAIHKLLQNILAIEETTPYHCTIEVSSATDRQLLQGRRDFSSHEWGLEIQLFYGKR